MPKAGRRGNGEGTITKRRDGRFMARLSLPNGERKAVYGKTQQEALSKLRLVQRNLMDGAPVVAENETVGSFLRSWLEGKAPSIKPKTYVTYEGLIRLHINPEIGNVRMARLTPERVQLLYSGLLRSGLAARSVRHVHAVLHEALEQAVRWNKIPRNVAGLIDLPRVQKLEMQVLDSGQVRTFLAAAKEDRLEALYVLAVTTGMRQGELLGLDGLISTTPTQR